MIIFLIHYFTYFFPPFTSLEPFLSTASRSMPGTIWYSEITFWKLMNIQMEKRVINCFWQIHDWSFPSNCSNWLFNYLFYHANNPYQAQQSVDPGVYCLSLRKSGYLFMICFLFISLYSPQNEVQLKFIIAVGFYLQILSAHIFHLGLNILRLSLET